MRVMPAARMRSTAACVVAAATPAVRSSRTEVAKPSRAASSAVATTQWSVAMPITSTAPTPASRSHAASPVPPGPCPSKPEYAAWYSPLSKTASISDRSRSGCSSTPPVPTTQCAGQVVTKSGDAAKCVPGSMWWSRVATTWS
jgi:hypothetical protein